MVTDETLSQLVAIGASAGGIEALTVALATLPANFGAPIVIAQHLDPARASHLGDVLQRHSPLPVRTVIDESRMDAGVVYVVPADRDVEIADGHVRVLVRESGVGADASSDSGGTLEGNNPPAPSER